jgi:hypothetical protein
MAYINNEFGGGIRQQPLEPAKVTWSAPATGENPLEEAFNQQQAVQREHGKFLDRVNTVKDQLTPEGVRQQLAGFASSAAGTRPSSAVSSSPPGTAKLRKPHSLRAWLRSTRPVTQRQNSATAGQLKPQYGKPRACQPVSVSERPRPSLRAQAANSSARSPKLWYPPESAATLSKALWCGTFPRLPPR